MKALIIGAAGFVGSYLINELAVSSGWTVSATKLPFEQLETEQVRIIDLDILDENMVLEILRYEQPDLVYHLAAQSSVALSWEKPALTVDVNIKGAVNLLEAVRRLERKPRVVLIGSSEEYGPVSGDYPVNESVKPNPQSIYALTKYTQNIMGTLFARAYGLDIIATRSFNHIGPGQSSRFVIADFCKQVAEIALKQKESVMYTGNLNVKRDFTDVRDVVRAYALLGIHGKSGETYNIGSGKAVLLSEIVNILVGFSGKEISIVIDKKKLRPIEVLVVCADISKLKKDTGWTPLLSLQQSLHDTYLSFLENGKLL
jgi:GDP-4-dehydro-6-deoxy-D-mannose reductase